MNIEKMQEQIENKCKEFEYCSTCPLHRHTDICYSTDNYDIIKANYDVMFPKEEKEENMGENYAVINGKRFILDDEMTKVITENQINHKIYNIGHIEIKPNWVEGYIKDSDEQDEGAIYIGDEDNSLCITHKELPKVVKALIEIQNYLNDLDLL